VAVTRTVTMPLSREPEVLFGLRLADLFWVMGSGVSDLALWHALRTRLLVRFGGMGIVSGVGLLLAVVRMQDASLPDWVVRWCRFMIAAHLYLP